MVVFISIGLGSFLPYSGFVLISSPLSSMSGAGAVQGAESVPSLWLWEGLSSPTVLQHVEFSFSAFCETGAFVYRCSVKLHVFALFQIQKWFNRQDKNA